MLDSVSIAILGGLGLAFLFGGGSEAPSEGGLGFGEPGDGEVWERVVTGGDPLFGLSIGEAAVCDPRRVEALLQQRVLRPLRLALARMSRPNLSVDQIDSQLRRAWIRRNALIRSNCGCVSIESLARSSRDAWVQDSRTLGHLVASSTPLSSVFVAAVRANADDIRAAFAESLQICGAAREADRTHSDSWGLLCSTLESAAFTLESLFAPGSAPTDTIPIDLVSDEDGDRMGALTMGLTEVDEDYGLHLDPGPSLDDEDEDDDDLDDFGLQLDPGPSLDDDDDVSLDPAFAEYIVSGHRAPTVGLGDYRRSGGRFFGRSS